MSDLWAGTIVDGKVVYPNEKRTAKAVSQCNCFAGEPVINSKGECGCVTALTTTTTPVETTPVPATNADTSGSLFDNPLVLLGLAVAGIWLLSSMSEEK